MSGYSGMPGSAGPWSGGATTRRAHCVLAPNPGVMTLDGTNTWLIQEPDSPTVGIIDPGPDLVEHWSAVESEVRQRDARIDLIVLTHGHADHSAGARLFAERAGCSVRALDPSHRLGSEGLAGGDVLELGGARVDVVATPGHSSDSLSFHLVADRALLTGDTVLGRGTTVVAHPDGQLGDYLQSLDRLRELSVDAGLRVILPGHGPTLIDPIGVLDAYLSHRQSRLYEVGAVVAELADQGLSADQLAQAVVEQVYADVPRAVWPAALLSVRAQLLYLAKS